MQWHQLQNVSLFHHLYSTSEAMGGEPAAAVVAVGCTREPLTPRVRSLAAVAAPTAAAGWSVHSSWAFYRWILKKAVCQSADLVDSRAWQEGNLKTLGQPAQISLSGKFPFFGRFSGAVPSFVITSFRGCPLLHNFWNKKVIKQLVAKSVSCPSEFQIYKRPVRVAVLSSTADV